MATEIIDGVGTQNHVTSDQVGLSQAGMIGSGAIILPVGEQLGYDIISNNQVNIKDGVYVIQGKRGWIQTGTVEQCTIDTGNNGQYRNDLICVKYTKDAQSKVEQFAIAVVKGTPGAAGTDPTYTTGDINNGALESYTPIYRVRLNGINIVGVDLMASKINSMLDMVADIGNLTALTTTEKNSLVGAINELKTAINTLNGNMIENTIVHSVDFATINAGGALNPGIYCGEITGTPNDSGQPLLITDVYQVSSIGTIRIQHLYNVGLDEFHIRTKFNDFGWTEWHQIY